MQRLGAEAYVDVSRRNEILLQIAGMRAKEMHVLDVLKSIPAWATQPFKGDQNAFNQALDAYTKADAVVRNLEARLTVEQGPIWKEMTPQESAALKTWTDSLNALYGYVSKYFPTRFQESWGYAALAAIAIGSFIAPLFLDTPEKGVDFPFHVDIPRLPKSPTPAAPAAARPSAMPVYPTFSPTSFSRIPGAAAGRSPLRVQPEIMRPASSEFAPWKRIESRPAAPGAAPVSPGFRTFTRPLDIPVKVQTPAESAASATSSVPPISPHGPPRFRRQ